MSMRRLILSAAALSAPLILGAAHTLAAQSHQLYTWTGRVDREIQIAMRGREVWTRASDRDDKGQSRTRVSSALPHAAGYVRAEIRDGRGEVAVVQQPSARNNYTAIVRVRDRSGGSDRYRINVYWQNARGSRDGWPRSGDGDWDRSDDGDRDRSDDGDWQRGDTPRAGSRLPRVESRDRSNDGVGGGYGYGRTALRWSGAVDSEAEIRIQGRRADYRSLAGAGTRDVRIDVTGEGLPRRDVRLSIEVRQGRGSVVVVQHPSASNGYVGILRVRDPQGGFGQYDFDVSYH